MSLPKKDREWVILQADYESEDDFRRAIAEELARLENIGHRTGGAFVSSPLRIERPMPPVEIDGLVVTGLPEKEFVTIGWAFRQTAMFVGRPTEPPPAAEEPAPAPAEEAPAREPVALAE